MKQKQNIRLHPLLWLVIGLAVASVAVFVTALLLPPQGEVHPSVLKGLAILTGDISLVIFAYAIASGKTATFSHGKSNLTVGKRIQEDANN